TQCKNNLKQIGLGFQTYYTAKKYFPSSGGGTQSIYDANNPASTIPGVPAAEALGFSFQILPFVEETSLYQAGINAPNGPSQAMPALQNQPIQSQSVNVYKCPSRTDRFSHPTGFGAVYQMGDYAGIMQSWSIGGSGFYSPLNVVSP